MTPIRARPTRLCLVFTGSVLLASCSGSDNDPGPGGVSARDAHELDHAAEIIESRRPDFEIEARPDDYAADAGRQAAAGD